MKAVVIGGTGHIGTFLVPRLVLAGYEVICVSRQRRPPYQAHPAWESVEQVVMERRDEDPDFAKRIAAFKPEVVLDIISYSLVSARQMVEALRGRVKHFLHCGTIWIHGHSIEVPTTEDQGRNPFCGYGKQKLAIEEYLLDQARYHGFPATILHPGHIVGPGWAPVNPAGNINPEVFGQIARGEELILPNLGMETVHHVHADDVAQSFQQALRHYPQAVGESFHVVSPQAITLRGFAEKMAAWFGKEARLRFLPWEEWKTQASRQDAEITYDHVAHSPNCSIAKAMKLLDYQPRYTSLEAVFESVQWLITHNLIRTVPAVT